MIISSEIVLNSFNCDCLCYTLNNEYKPFLTVIVDKKYFETVFLSGSNEQIQPYDLRFYLMCSNIPIDTIDTVMHHINRFLAFRE